MSSEWQQARDQLRDYLIKEKNYSEHDLAGLCSEKVVSGLHDEYLNHKKAKSDKLRANAAKAREVFKARREAIKKDRRLQVKEVNKLIAGIGKTDINGR